MGETIVILLSIFLGVWTIINAIVIAAIIKSFGGKR